jgi:predicted RNA-binding protein
MPDGIAQLIGKRIKQIVEHSEDVVYIECDNNEAFRMYHMQDCCEMVRVWDITGDLNAVVGQVVLNATEDESREWPEGVPFSNPDESFTWTTFTVVTAAAPIVIRWLGESNGYYSESVYFERTHTAF